MDCELTEVHQQFSYNYSNLTRFPIPNRRKQLITIYKHPGVGV